MVRKLAKAILPVGSRRRRYIAKIVRKTGLITEKEVVEYYDYIMSLEGSQIPLVESSDKEGVKFSIIVPAYNTPKKYLKPLLKSIIGQTYKNWELILVNASDDELGKARVGEAAELDTRIKVIEVPNKGIASNTNEGIKVAEGDYLIFSDHDDILDVRALHEVNKFIERHPKAGLLYSDEDKVTDDGNKFFAPHFKPNWSPDLLDCVNYITHLVVVKKTLADKVGMLSPEKDGAQDYDYLLRIVDSGTEVVHIPKILYHWREADSSTARSLQNKPHATNAGVLALKDHLVRKGITDADVSSIKNRPGFYKIVYKPAKEVTIIVTPFSSPAVLKQYLDRLITRTDVQNTKLKYIIPKSVNLDSEIKEYLDLVEIKKINARNDNEYLEKSLLEADECTIIVNKILLPLTKYWLRDFTGLMSIDRIAASSPVVIDDTDCIYDSGYVYYEEDLVRLFKGTPFTDNPTFFGNTEWCRNVNALTGNITIVRNSELLPFIKKQDSRYSINSLIKDFSLEQVAAGRDVTICSNVIFNDLTIISQPRASSGNNSSKFNPSLEAHGDMFHIVSDDETVISRMLRIPTEDKTYE